jgi:hypothetical protein
MSEKLTGTVIGIGAPNRTQDRRVVQCAILLGDDDIGFFRVFSEYEGKMEGLSLWDRCEVDVIASNKDSRKRSWKLVSSRLIPGKVVDREHKRELLESCCRDFQGDPINVLNKEKDSIGVVRATQSGIGYTMTHREFEESPDLYQTQSETPQKPYVRWVGQTGKPHESQLCSHEAYEWIRKNPSRPDRLWENMQLSNIDYDKWFVIGNIVAFQSTWVVVQVHRLKKTTQQHIGASWWISSGKPRDWPYCLPVDIDARRVASTGQGLLFTI